MSAPKKKEAAPAPKIFRMRRRAIFVSVVELFDAFACEWRFVDEDGAPIYRTPIRARSEAHALETAAFHCGMLPLEAGWWEVRS